MTRKRLAFLAAVVIVLGFWYTGPSILTGLGRFLVVRDTPQKVDVLIVLSGDDEGERLRYTYGLYSTGYGSTILICGGTNLYEETGIDLMKRYLVKLGVPPDRVLSEKRSGSTVENALFSSEILVQKGVGSATVITSPTHTRRVASIFRRTFPSSIRVLVTSNPATFDPANWWRDTRNRRAVVREFFQLGWYYMFGD